MFDRLDRRLGSVQVCDVTRRFRMTTYGGRRAIRRSDDGQSSRGKASQAGKHAAARLRETPAGRKCEVAGCNESRQLGCLTLTPENMTCQARLQQLGGPAPGGVRPPLGLNRCEPRGSFI